VSEAELVFAPSITPGPPRYDEGWCLDDGRRVPYLSMIDDGEAVNWSDELEDLHEEASRTHFIDRWTRGALLQAIREVRPDATIADLGCSTGYLLEDLRAAHRDATLIGVDMVAAGLIKAHETVPSARLLRADVCRLPLADASLDAVLSANLLEHVPDDTAALREIARVLRPGAHVAIVVPAGPRTYDYYDRFLGHERRYGRRELAGKCRTAGLEPVADHFIAASLYPAFWLVKQSHRIRFRGLQGDALQARVSADIARTQTSRAGPVLWRLEERLGAAGVRLPFGIRSFVVARRPEAGG
jgi:ubiquinone/menaquinone biosynthesis C-methylase UbiE